MAEEGPEIISKTLRELSIKVSSWNFEVPDANEFLKVAEELEACADKVGALVEENRSLREQIVELRYKLELEKMQD